MIWVFCMTEANAAAGIHSPYLSHRTCQTEGYPKPVLPGGESYFGDKIMILAKESFMIPANRDASCPVWKKSIILLQKTLSADTVITAIDALGKKIADGVFDEKSRGSLPWTALNGTNPCRRHPEPGKT